MPATTPASYIYKIGPFVSGTCLCGHVGWQRDPNVCGACASLARPSPLKQNAYVDGTCACGHAGLQKRPDICGPCHRAMTRPKRESEPSNRQRGWRLVRSFKEMSREDQRQVLTKMQDHYNNA